MPISLSVQKTYFEWKYFKIGKYYILHIKKEGILEIS